MTLSSNLQIQFIKGLNQSDSQFISRKLPHSMSTNKMSLLIFFKRKSCILDEICVQPRRFENTSFLFAINVFVVWVSQMERDKKGWNKIGWTMKRLTIGVKNKNQKNGVVGIFHAKVNAGVLCLNTMKNVLSRSKYYFLSSDVSKFRYRSSEFISRVEILVRSLTVTHLGSKYVFFEGIRFWRIKKIDLK